MKATIMNYRGGKRTQNTNEMILEVDGVGSKEDAKKILKKKVEWTTPSGKKMMGEVSKLHGGKGCVIARFEKGLPGQAIGTQAEVL